MFSSLRTAASSSSRNVMIQSEEPNTSSSPSSSPPALHNKGKGRATSPDTPHSSFCLFSEEGERPHMSTIKATPGLYLSSQQSFSSSSITPKSTDLASPLTPPLCQSDSGHSLHSSLDCNQSKGVSLDLGDPFNFDSFVDQQRPYRLKANFLGGLRRRPFQNGIAPNFTQSEQDDRLSTIDRASIFSGLRSSATRSPPPPPSDALLIESMSTSSKRSFEEAISPISSPLSTDESTITGLLQEDPARAFTSSLSDSFDLLRGNHHTVSSTQNRATQTTRRRVPHKRQRAAASHAQLEVDSLAAPLNEYLSAMHEGDGSISERNESVLSERRSQSTDQTMQTGVPLPNSLDDSPEADVTSVDLPSSTTQLLRQWWVDTEEQSLSGSQTGSAFSSEVEMGNEQGAAHIQSSRNESVRASSSSTVSVSGRSLPGSHTVLRRLQLQEREEEEDVQLQETTSTTAVPAVSSLPSSPSSESNYHDELMDVLRRMSNRSGQDLRPSVPRPPLRSATMTRSTTQLSEVLSRSDSHHRREDVADDEGSDLSDIISSYIEEQDDVARMRRPASSNMLPSARAYASEHALDRLTQASLSSQISSLQGRNNATTFRELARRNQEVLQRYSDPEARLRPLHAGSPTISSQERDVSRDQEQAIMFQEQIIGRQERDSNESIFHYRPPSSRRPNLALATSASIQAEVEADSPSWGEYLLSRGPSSRGRSSTTLDEQISSAAETTSATSSYLCRLSERLSSSNTNSFTSTARRRIGTLDSSGRLRGPTRRLNENWLGMNSSEEGIVESSSSLDRLRRVTHMTPSLEEQERVMSTYRRMNFPDPEASITSTIQQETRSSLLNRPPQLPTLRSRSPFELPFPSLTEGGISTSNADHSMEDINIGDENAPSSISGRHITRPHLRSLTLTSRSATSSALIRRSLHPETGIATERRDLPNFRNYETTNLMEHRAQRRAGRFESQSQRASELRVLFDETGRDELMINHLDDLSESRRRRLRLRNEIDIDQRETSLPSTRHDELTSAASSHLSRRLPVARALSASRSFRQRTSEGLYTRRRPTLLEANSSAVVDMELPNRDRFDLDSFMTSSRQSTLTRQEMLDSTLSNQMAPLTTSPSPSSSSRPASRRPISRWDRYMGDLGTSNGIRSIMESESQELPSSSQSFYSSLSRLPGGSLASTLHSEIASNPANYVPDDEFALRDTYEDLLQLSAQIGDVRCKFTPAHVIGKLPTCLYTHWLGGSCKETPSHHNQSLDDLDNIFDFSSKDSSPDKGKSRAREGSEQMFHYSGSSSSKDTSCSICLESYSALDTVMSLPCNHAFHESCLITWLKSARSCPCCRGDVCVNEVGSTKANTLTSSSVRFLPELYI